MPSLKKLYEDTAAKRSAAMSKLTDQNLALVNELKAESDIIYSDGTIDNKMANDMLLNICNIVNNILPGLSKDFGFNDHRFSDIRGGYVESRDIQYHSRLASITSSSN